jgi:membrane-associated phospholipid phosphatase
MKLDSTLLKQLSQINFPTSAVPRSILLLQSIYLVVLTVYANIAIGFPTISYIALCVFLGLLWHAPSRSFLIAFAPFCAMVLCYEQLRGIANQITPADLHIMDLVRWERALFGGRIPCYWIQQMAGGGTIGELLWVVSTIIYGTHFLTPVVLALWIWGRKRECYWSYVGRLLTITYIGFLGYVIFPAAPPWMASHIGAIPERINPHFPVEILLRGPNPVAAMPSLHAAWAAYVAIVGYELWGWRIGTALLTVPAAMCFATVYLGHHYVIDQIAGWMLTTVVVVLLDRYRVFRSKGQRSCEQWREAI